MKKHFFVSYNGRDKHWAEWIAWILEEAGYSVIIQAWDFRPAVILCWKCRMRRFKLKKRSLFSPITT